MKVIINYNESIRIVKGDNCFTIENLREVKNKDTGLIEKKFVTYPNFYTGNFKRAVEKVVEIIIHEEFKEQFESIEEYMKKQVEILKRLEKGFQEKIEVKE